MHRRTAMILAFATWLVPSAALAKDACIRTDVAGGWTFVLHKARLKPGVSAAVSGHAVRDDGLAEAVSGGYIVFPGTVLLGVTRYLTGLSTTGGGGGSSFETSFHQIQVDFEGSGSDYSWTREIGGNIVTENGDAALVSCEAVPRIPKQ